MSSPPSPFRALARFHLAVGGRLAAIVLAPVFAAGFGAGMLLGVDFLNSLAHLLYGSDGPRPAGAAGALWIALVTVGAARTAAPRVCGGLSGWIRHLPADALAHRRAAALAIGVAQLPLLLLLAVLAPVTLHRPERLAAAFLGLVLSAAAAALFAVPVARPLLARPLALAAALLAAAGSWPALGVAVLLILATDLAAGGLPAGSKAARSSARRPEPLEGGASARWLPPRIAWRALGWRLAGAYLAALLPWGAAALFVANNQLSPWAVGLAARLGGGAAAVLLLAQLGEALAVQRPAWPWARSLPQSALARVAADALFLGAHASPVVALAAWIAPRAALPVALTLPYLALRSAGALRRAPERKTGASGEILMEGMWLAAAVALLPWASLALVAVAPLAARSAAERERRQKVSRWLEIHHLAAGDPQSWSAS